MDATPQVVDFKRRSRLYPEVKPWIQANTNTLCLVLLFVGFCMAWMRAINIKAQRRDQF